MSSAASKPTLGDFARLLGHGTSLTIATRSEDFVPDVCRLAAVAVRDDGTVLVAIPMPEGARALSNVDANGAVAVTACRPTTYETLQLKAIDGRRHAWPDAALSVDAHRAGFVREVHEVGMPSEISRGMWSHSWIAIVLTPTEIRVQTPGAGVARPSMKVERQ